MKTVEIIDTLASGKLESKKREKHEKSSNLPIRPSKPHSNLLKKTYTHSCHTCNIHFSAEKGFEKHMLESQAHRSFKLASNIAEDLGYLDPLGTKFGLYNLSHNRPRYFDCHRLRANDLNPCTKPNCTCPRFRSAALEHVPNPVIRGPMDYLYLDGIAGSTMYGESRDDEEENTLNFCLKRPYPPSDEGDGPYVRPPDSDDEEEMEQHRAVEEQKKKDLAAATIAAAESERRRKIQDEIDMRRRFSKGKNRKIARIEQQRADRAVYEAYIAADETLFGQQRFEEVAEEESATLSQAPPQDHALWTKEKREAAIANWQREMGQTDYNVEAKDFESELAKQIDSLIMDTLFEVALQEDEEKRNKASLRYKNKLFFKDTIEEIAIDHGFSIEDKYQEKLRKTVGKGQTKQLNSLLAEDIVDNIAIDHTQELCERGEEKYRGKVGKMQTKVLNRLKMEDMVDGIAMGHNQEVYEREEELFRKSEGKIQSKDLRDLRMEDIVDDLVMGHTQGVVEKQQEHRRRDTGRIENKKLTSLEMDDIVDSLVMDYSQGVGERAVGRTQSMNNAGLEIDEIIDDLAMIHNREVDERFREHQRKTSGYRQTKKIKIMRGREEDIVENMAMDHFQEVSEKLEGNQRNIAGRKQNIQLAALREDNLVDILMMDHTQNASDNEREHCMGTIRRQQNRNLAVIDMDHIFKGSAVGHPRDFQNRELGHQKGVIVSEKNRGLPETVDYLAATEKKKSETFITRFLSSNNDGGIKINKGTGTRSHSGKGEEWYDQDGGVELPKNFTGTENFSAENETTELHAVTKNTSEFDEYDNDCTNLAPAPKTIKQKRKEAQAKYDAMIDDMARAQHR